MAGVEGGLSKKIRGLRPIISTRFGNFNVLAGTSIPFYTEAGAIDRSSVTGATGSTSVTFRTQNPLPRLFTVVDGYILRKPPTDFALYYLMN